jgi:hypothetical protein
MRQSLCLIPRHLVARNASRPKFPEIARRRPCPPPPAFGRTVGTPGGRRQAGGSVARDSGLSRLRQRSARAVARGSRPRSRRRQGAGSPLRGWAPDAPRGAAVGRSANAAPTRQIAGGVPTPRGAAGGCRGGVSRPVPTSNLLRRPRRRRSAERPNTLVVPAAANAARRWRRRRNVPAGVLQRPSSRGGRLPRCVRHGRFPSRRRAVA